MQKVFVLLVLVALGLFPAGGFSEAKNVSANASPPIRIGLILPLTGSATSLTEPILRGARMAAEDLAQSSGITVELVAEDDGMEPRRSSTAAQKLVDVDSVHGLFSFSSGSGHAVVGIAERKGILHFSIASDAAISRNRPLTFLFWPRAEDEAAVIVEEIKKDGRKNLAIVSVIHPGALAIRDPLVAGLKLAVPDIKILDEEVPPDTQDFRHLVSKIRSMKSCDGIVPLLFPGGLATFARQVQEGGVSAPWYGFETMDDKNEIARARGAFEGAVFASAHPGSKSFRERFFEKYGKDASVYGASTAYDAITLMARALHAAPGAKAGSWIRELPPQDLVSGKVSVGEDGRFILPPALFRVVEGRPKLVE